MTAPRTPLLQACASSWAAPLSLPFWLKSRTRRSGKVRLQGSVHLVYPEQARLAVQGAQGDDLVWVSYDDGTRFLDCQPDDLHTGQKVRIDGVLAATHMHATRIQRV